MNESIYTIEFTPRIDNIWRNSRAINNGQYKIHYFLIETTHNFPKDLNISNFMFMYSVKHIDFNYNIEDTKTKEFMKNVKNQYALSKNTNYYLFGIKVFDCRSHTEPIGDAIEICRDYLDFLSYRLFGL